MHKPLNTKIGIKYYKMLEAMHRQSDIPKSRLVERSLELLAKQLREREKAYELLQSMEEAERDYAEGRARPLEEVIQEIDQEIASKKPKK